MELKGKPLNEDRVALLLGSFIFILAMARFAGVDMLGWAVKTGMWVDSPLVVWLSSDRRYVSPCVSCFRPRGIPCGLFLLKSVRSHPHNRLLKFFSTDT